ncbi:hypothetical protein BDN70DRAFT_992570 [Pholiota conissans]|uniref:Uncharacterized protein n=1 Tax=Pholiota conissans TaxID=109636 RepID=A0A9P5Z6Z0_9AGAR|nr:hypothetical protein BDN70DRAFT_992570 [Pholiota conissans]
MLPRTFLKGIIHLTHCSHYYASSHQIQNMYFSRALLVFSAIAHARAVALPIFHPEQQGALITSGASGYNFDLTENYYNPSPDYDDFYADHIKDMAYNNFNGQANVHENHNTEEVIIIGDYALRQVLRHKLRQRIRRRIHRAIQRYKSLTPEERRTIKKCIRRCIRRCLAKHRLTGGKDSALNLYFY